MSKKNIAIINGPNLNKLGLREPEHYGNDTLETIISQLEKLVENNNCNIFHFQSNHEGNLIDYLHENMSILDGIILNPAGLSKTGYSLLDSLLVKPIPYVEVHLSNIFARGGWHAESIFSSNSVGLICGFQGYGYQLALLALLDYLT